MPNYDFLIIGGGVFGVTTAIELAKRKYRIGLLNPGSIPHPQASSTDVSKAVRMEYGSDKAYFRMAQTSIERWKEWNVFFDEEFYVEVGFLMLCPDNLQSERQAFERQSYANLLEAGYTPEHLDTQALEKRFPAVSGSNYPTAIFNPVGGYAKSGRVIEVLTAYARSLGVTVHQGEAIRSLVVEKGHLQAVLTQSGNAFQSGHTVVAAGAHTPYLLPELKPYMKVTGHPVFWLKPKETSLYTYPHLSVFTADISNSGWYGFPFLPEHGIVKIGRHAQGVLLHPDLDERSVRREEIVALRSFLKFTFPKLADAPIVYTRKCLYTDTLDGHFWIDNHPEIKGLTVSTGGSGHAFKMAPLLGEMTADVVEGKIHPFSKRFRWRHLTGDTKQGEEARNLRQ